MLTFEEILKATGGRLLYGTPNGIRGVSIDSRTIGEGELFVAINGARFDGHDFVFDALKKGCGAVVSVPPTAAPRGKVVIHVQNTLRALQDMANYLRKKTGIKVVGITGTNGKTTTKEMTSSILGTGFGVLKNTGNLNNQIGLPLSLLKLSGGERAAILEMGASAPGDIRELCAVAEPEYGVITNVGFAHLEGFASIEAVRQTKLEMLDFVTAAALNADDAFLMEGAGGFGGEVVTYGLSGTSVVTAADVDPGGLSKGASFTLRMGGRHTRVCLRVMGLFNVYNALAAASVGLMFGIDAEAVREGLEGFSGVPMRLEVKEFDGATVISDMYNANPASMEEAVKELVRLRRGRAVAVLGDMLELGPYAEVAHRKLGAWMSGLPIDLFIAVGPMMGIAADEFRGKSLRAEAAERAGRLLIENFGPEDTILIKGSRGMRMEGVIDPSFLRRSSGVKNAV